MESEKTCGGCMWEFSQRWYRPCNRCYRSTYHPDCYEPAPPEGKVKDVVHTDKEEPNG